MGEEDDHNSHERHDYFGNDMHQAPNGEWLTEKTGTFGDTVYEDESGHIVTEEKDYSGNTVFTDTDNNVVAQEAHDAFGNNVITDEGTGDYVIEHEALGGVAYSGDVDSFGKPAAEPERGPSFLDDLRSSFFGESKEASGASDTSVASDDSNNGAAVSGAVSSEKAVTADTKVSFTDSPSFMPIIVTVLTIEFCCIVSSVVWFVK